jgi:hypothetical protein
VTVAVESGQQLGGLVGCVLPVVAALGAVGVGPLVDPVTGQPANRS